MRLGNYLTKLTKPELDEIRELLNLTDDEEIVFNELSKGRSIVATADKCMVACSTVSNRIRDISYKLEKLKKGEI